MAKKIWKFFCSVKLTVVLFVLILIPSIIGTIIRQNAPNPSQYIMIYGPAWDAIFRFLGFYDVYHDPRFSILLVLLGLNTLACTVNRLKFQWNRLGTMMTHFGLLFILIGALMGAIFGVKGFMAIREGETTDQMSVGGTAQTVSTLPFQVKLVDFVLETEEKPTHEITILNVKTDRQQSYTAEEGRTVQLPRSRWARLDSILGLPSGKAGTLKVERIIPTAAKVTSIKEGPDETGVAAMEFRLIAGGEEQRDFAFSQLEHPYVLEQARLAVGYLKVDSPQAVDAEIQKALSLHEAANQIEIAVPQKDIKKTYPAAVGSKFKVEGAKNYSVEVLRYEPDFVISGRDVISRSAFPNNPAILARITGPSGTEDQWFFSKFPTAHMARDLPFQLVFKMNPHLSDMADFVIVINPTKGKPILADIHEGKLVAKTYIELGQPVGIEKTEYKIAVDKFIRNANMINKIENRPDLPNKPAIEISVEQAGALTPYYLWQDVQMDIPGYKMVYTQENRIKDFISNLQVINSGKVAAEKKITVNDPLRYGGYTLYQSSYDQKGLSWSGLQVKKDPGVSLVYAGFTVLILGMVIIFYINPLLRKARRS